MLEPNNVYLGSCYDLIKQIPDKSVDLIITDPPYDFSINESATGIFKYRKNMIGAYKEMEDKNLNKGIDRTIYDEWVRVMKYIYIYMVQQRTNNRLLRLFC